MPVLENDLVLLAAQAAEELSATSRSPDYEAVIRLGKALPEEFLAHREPKWSGLIGEGRPTALHGLVSFGKIAVLQRALDPHQSMTSLEQLVESFNGVVEKLANPNRLNRETMTDLRQFCLELAKSIMSARPRLDDERRNRMRTL